MCIGFECAVGVCLCTAQCQAVRSIIRPSSQIKCVLSFTGFSGSTANVCPSAATRARTLLSRNLFKLNFECDALFVFVVSIFEMNLENEFLVSAAAAHERKKKRRKMKQNVQRKSSSDLPNV